MSNYDCVRDFLRSTSYSEYDNGYIDGKYSLPVETMRAETLLEYEYTHRSDHCVYPPIKPQFVNVNHMIIMVGLPARGKTYIARKLCRYLNWCGIASKVLSVGEYRRKAAGTDLKHEFFIRSNIEAEKIRQNSLSREQSNARQKNKIEKEDDKQCYWNALEDGAAWMEEKPENKVVIFDASNTTRSRRESVYSFCIEHSIKPFFIESVFNDEDIIDSFVKDIQEYSPDYVETNYEERVNDFNKRMKHYKDEYETISDQNEIEKKFSYIKTINAGKQFLINNANGYLHSQVVYYLMNIHTQKRSLYITAHGECDYNVKQELGGNSGLTKTGKLFASALSEYMKKESLQNFRVWTSSIQGCIETSKYINGPIEIWRNLDYLNCGEYHGMKFTDLAKQYPDQFTESSGPLDFNWRYPSGESYHDMLSRLEPVIMELERQQNVLVISHRTTIRCLMAYFLEHNPDEVGRIKVPLHTLFKVTPIAYGCRLEKATLDVQTGRLTKYTVHPN
ncbi:6-phosphofructo-2-kinase/fructose-2,6-bisphosphatase 1 isoform X1 [Hydra vulgaris]|uniref:6-phosphofructo-2-kinase/fructose-2, 6-bisphosphatase 1 isoform X1 n=1 Tax=Hydra vulgaris TaxID=6087 RepID=UPI000641047B|nr:6-phosphofructo-2-kinase/fructose-2,6-bisphosphatase 1 isoform X1 [Hydra vulgaris]